MKGWEKRWIVRNKVTWSQNGDLRNAIVANLGFGAKGKSMGNLIKWCPELGTLSSQVTGDEAFIPL